MKRNPSPVTPQLAAKTLYAIGAFCEKAHTIEHFTLSVHCEITKTEGDIIYTTGRRFYRLDLIATEDKGNVFSRKGWEEVSL